MKRGILLIALILFTLPLARLMPDTSDEYRSYYNKFFHWEMVYQSIAYVESEFNHLAVSNKGAGGIIQIMPKGSGGYLDEANRLLKEDRYVDKDRFCPIRAREIWDTVMKYRNPEKSLKKAIKLHNPKAGGWYEERVMKKYNELIK